MFLIFVTLVFKNLTLAFPSVFGCLVAAKLLVDEKHMCDRGMIQTCAICHVHCNFIHLIHFWHVTVMICWQHPQKRYWTKLSDPAAWYSAKWCEDVDSSIIASNCFMPIINKQTHNRDECHTQFWATSSVVCLSEHTYIVFDVSLIV